MFHNHYDLLFTFIVSITPFAFIALFLPSTFLRPKGYKLIFTVPDTHLSACRAAVFAAGGGTYPGGKYTHVSFEQLGSCQFLPAAGAQPAKGTVGSLELGKEWRVEIFCKGERVARNAVKALKR